MPTASLINDDQKYPNALGRNRDGLTGTRFYRVDCATHDEALAADGLPVLGDPWSQSRLRLQLDELDARRERMGGNWFIVRAQYRINTGQIPAVGPGVVTRIIPSTTTRNVNFDITGTRKLTSDGRGVPRLVTVTLFEVVRYFTEMPNLTPYRNITDEPKLNAGGVALPNLFGSGTNLSVAAGELLYAKFTPASEGELFSIRSELHWRRDWRHYKNAETPAGEPAGAQEALDLYESGDFTGLL